MNKNKIYHGETGGTDSSMNNALQKLIVDFTGIG